MKTTAPVSERPDCMFDPRDVAGRMPLVLAWLAVVGVTAMAAMVSAWLALTKRDAGRGWGLVVRGVLVATAILAVVDGGVQNALGVGVPASLAMAAGILFTIALARIPSRALTPRSMLIAGVLTLGCGIACLRLRAVTSPDAYVEPTLVEPAIEYEDTVTGARAITDGGTTIRLGRFVLNAPKPLIPDGFDGRVIVADATNSRANCHGWVFTGGEYRVSSEDIDTILADNGYERVAEAVPNDLIIYRDDEGRVVHTGLVKAVGPGGFALIESKWGPLDIYWHTPDDQVYSQRYDFYRSPRDGHLLRVELPEADVTVPAEAD